MTTESRYQAGMGVRSPATHKTSHIFYPRELPKGSLSGVAHWSDVQSWDTDNGSNLRLRVGWGPTSRTSNTSLP